jgi:hypothetical protein
MRVTTMPIRCQAPAARPQWCGGKQRNRTDEKTRKARSLAEPTHELNKRAGSLDHLIAKAEIIRHQPQAQLDDERATTATLS